MRSARAFCQRAQPLTASACARPRAHALSACPLLQALGFLQSYFGAMAQNKQALAPAFRENSELTIESQHFRGLREIQVKLAAVPPREGEDAAAAGFVKPVPDGRRDMHSLDALPLVAPTAAGAAPAVTDGRAVTTESSSEDPLLRSARAARASSRVRRRCFSGRGAAAWLVALEWQRGARESVDGILSAFFPFYFGFFFPQRKDSVSFFTSTAATIESPSHHGLAKQLSAGRERASSVASSSSLRCSLSR